MILFVTMAILMAADWGGLHFQEPRPRRTGGETRCRREGLGSLPGRGAYERMLCSRIVIQRSVQQGGGSLASAHGGGGQDVSRASDMGDPWDNDVAVRVGTPTGYEFEFGHADCEMLRGRPPGG